MNIVLGSAFLLLTGIFYILVSGEKGNRKQKGARWIQRWGRKHGWQLPEWMTEECIWQTELAVLVAGVLLIAAGVTEQAENGQEISQLRRPAYGQGIQEENLEVEWRDEQGNRKKESMTVDVIEKQLSEKEIETIFSEVRGAIEKEILGENESLKHVDHPLYLREELQEYPVTVRWFSSRPEILDWEGRHGENIREDGEAVTLTAIIGLQGQERNESWDILVFPEISDEKRQVEDMVEKANADTEKGSEWMQLPKTLHGEKLVWKKVGDGMQYGVALLAFALPVMVLLHRQQKEKEHKKEEQQQMQHLTDYTSMEHATDPLRYQLEYVIGGKNTDQENLKAVVYRLLAAREAANMMYLLQDPTRQAEIHEMALVICAAIGFPALEGIVSLALQAAWAFGESLLDVRQLLTGGKVPLVKTGDTWMVSLHQLAKITELLKNSRAVEQKGMTYQEYLGILLMTGKSEVQTERTMDIVEAVIRGMSGKENFRLDQGVIYLEVDMGVTFAEKTFSLQRDYGYAMGSD